MYMETLIWECLNSICFLFGFCVKVVQKRNSSDVNFTREWKEYKDGFGEATGNY